MCLRTPDGRERVGVDCSMRAGPGKLLQVFQGIPTVRQRPDRVSPSRRYSEARTAKQAAKRPVCHSSNPAPELDLGSDFGLRLPSHGSGTSGRASRKALRYKE